MPGRFEVLYFKGLKAIKMLLNYSNGLNADSRVR